MIENNPDTRTLHCPVCNTVMGKAPVRQNIYECDRCGAVIALIFEEPKKTEPTKTLYQLVAHFETDGDYGIRTENIAEAYKKCIEKSENSFDISFETYDIHSVARLLDQIMVSFKICPSHYWLIPELYNLVKKVRDALFDDSIEHTYEPYNNGNYDGTEIVLNKILE